MPTAAAPSLPLSYSTPRNFHFVTLSTLKFIAIRENKGGKVPSELGRIFGMVERRGGGGPRPGPGQSELSIYFILSRQTQACAAHM